MPNKTSQKNGNHNLENYNKEKVKNPINTSASKGDPTNIRWFTDKRSGTMKGLRLIAINKRTFMSFNFSRNKELIDSIESIDFAKPLSQYNNRKNTKKGFHIDPQGDRSDITVSNSQIQLNGYKEEFRSSITKVEVPTWFFKDYYKFINTLHMESLMRNEEIYLKNEGIEVSLIDYVFKLT